MSLINFFKLGIRTIRKRNKHVIKQVLCLFIIAVLLLNFLSMIINNNPNNFTNNSDNSLETKRIDDKFPLSSGDYLPIYQDPYTVNFSDMWTFFKTAFKSPINDYDIDLYLNESDNSGTILHNVTYSRDNLLLYKSLLSGKSPVSDINYDESETFDAYLELKKTNLWYYGNSSQYGFVKSINGTTEEIIDDNRYLVDNLMPIFLLLENSNVANSKDEIIKTFLLINSSEFWDSTDYGFYEINSTDTGDKYVESNLYAVLANFLIYRYKTDINNATITDRAYEIAKLTMENLVNKTWDNTYGGFYHSADQYWSASSDEHKKKYLSVNALGILALLEYWIMTGMKNDSVYLNNATALYERLNTNWQVVNGGLWNTTYTAYQYNMIASWNEDNDPKSRRIDLEANALMMLACLKFFEVNGSYFYYEKAITLFESLKKYFYNTSLDANKISHGIINNTNISFHSNLKLCEAYLKAFEIYNSTILTATYNITGKTDYIVFQDAINLTCTYYFERDVTYYNPSSLQFGINTTRYENITGATVNFIIRFPNETIYKTISKSTINSTVSLLYPINNTLPFGDGYSIDVVANKSYFRFQYKVKTFNVISGLQIESNTLKSKYYQGETANFSIDVRSNYNFNLTLNVSLSGRGIKHEDPKPINVTFINNSITTVGLNMTVFNEAHTGFIDLYFAFINGTTMYLNDSIQIEIDSALSYANLIYSKTVVPGDYVLVFVELINFLPNESQEFNLTFSSSYITTSDVYYKIKLDENEKTTMQYMLGTKTNIKEDSITIIMRILKGGIEYHNATLTVKIVPRFEIIRIEFPEDVPHWVTPTLVIIIQNNLRNAEDFSLLINEDEMEIDKETLIPGENKLLVTLPFSWNPYDIGKKTCKVEIEDSTEDVVIKDYFEYELEVTAIDLIFFYVIPIAIPIGIILYFKNKDIKHKLLKR